MDQHRKLRGLVIVIFTLAAVLFALPAFRDYQALRLADKQTVHYQTKLPQIQPAQTIEPVMLSTMLNYAKQQDQNAVGQMAIPAIGLRDDVYTSLTNVNLTFGAVSLFPNREPLNHNLVLVAHNMGLLSLHFGSLARTKIGQTVYLQYLGKYYQYKIYKKTTILENQIERVHDTVGDSQISLVTCSAATRTVKRILVQARLTRVVAGEKALKATKDQIEQTSKVNHHAIQNDEVRAWWLPLFLIGLGWLGLIRLVFWTTRKK
ncbi:MAG: class A sortase [Lactobacillaceae bacterium]|jgi:LPXTG-site transpeptidase (sortase) family protein|nr:class A sortase [Lactobacillaceae bacterium]